MNAQSSVIARWKRLSTGSLNRRIFSATMLVGGLTLAIKVLAMVKEMVSAASFGIGDELDAFLVGYVLPSFTINVLAGQMNAAFIPVFVEVREKEGPAAAQRLFSGGLVLSMVVLGCAVLLLAAIAPVALPLICSGFSPEKLRLTLQLFYLLLPVVLLSGLAMNCESALNAGEKFIFAHVAAAVVPVTSMILLWTMAPRWGVHTLVYGLVGGIGLQLVLMIFALKKKGLHFAPRWQGFDPALRRLVGQYLPAVAASATMCSSQVIDQSMASMLDAGSVASLNYGNKLVAFALSIGAMGLGTAVLPFFSKMAAAAQWDALRHTLKTYIRLILLVTIPIVIGGILLSKPLVALFFQRGNFTEADTVIVARIQSMFLLQLPFYTLVILFVRMISSLQANRVLMWGTAISFAVNITFNYVLMQSMGAAGIALATSIVYAVLSVFLGVVLWTKLKGMSDPVQP